MTLEIKTKQRRVFQVDTAKITLEGEAKGASDFEKFMKHIGFFQR